MAIIFAQLCNVNIALMVNQIFIFHILLSSSYYIVVVFIDPLQGLYAILFGDTVGLVLFSYHSMVTERLQPQSLCIVVNQLDTA